MPVYIEIINKVLSIGTIFLQTVILFILINFIFYRNRENQVFVFFKKYTFYLGFLVALGAVLLSLFYSDVVGYPPCELCWIQRIFLYPLAILTGVSLILGISLSKKFILSLAVPGMIVAAYHVLIQAGIIKEFITCSSAKPCNTIDISLFGFLTIPMMSLIAFAIIVATILFAKYFTKANKNK